MLPDVDQLARTYGWSERDIFALSLRRRLAYRMLMESEADAALLAELTAGEPA